MAENRFIATIDVDFARLREQKSTLLRLANNPKGHNLSDQEVNHLDGLLNFLDALQDQAVDSNGIDEKLVFGPNSGKEGE